MKTTLLLCVTSAAIGAVLAVTLLDDSTDVTASYAQETVVRTVPSGVPTPMAIPSPPVDPQDMWTPEERINIAVYEQNNRGVVNINTKSVRSDGFFFHDIPSEGAGSGIVLDREGHVLTNFHVVRDAREVQVSLYNGKNYEARLVGIDPNTDMAVLKIEAATDELWPIRMGDSSRLRVGQRVYAIGNPFGLERTMTTGIISSLNRTLPSQRRHRSIEQVIQIDAAINPGNSGGPLVDSHGLMIGMNTAIYSKTGESAGVGFAVPANTIARFLPQLIEKGRVVRASLGIARVFQTEAGLMIATLVPDGASEKAGLQGPRIVRTRRQHGSFIYESRTLDRSVADIIIAVDGHPVTEADKLLDLVESRRPGEQVVLTVTRGGEQKDIRVTLDADE